MEKIMDNLVLEYAEEIKKRNLSLNTQEAYLSDLKRFSEFIEKRNEKIADVTEISIMAYVQQLISNDMANSSIARSMASIRGLYKHLILKGIVQRDPTMRYESLKVKRSLPVILTVEEVDKLLSMPDLSTIKGIRDRAMLEVMYGAGIRVSEMLELNMFDINIKLSYIICREVSKRERIIPIGSYAVKCLMKYYPVRNKINKYNKDYVFLNLRGGKMTRQGFWKIIKYYADEAKINKSINPYTLRHSFAVHLLQNGADLKCVQELLGHKDMATTQIYYNMSKKNKIAEVYKKTHPRA